MTDKDNTRTLREARLREAQRNVPEIETLADARRKEKQRKKQQRKERERAMGAALDSFVTGEGDEEEEAEEEEDGDAHVRADVDHAPMRGKHAAAKHQSDDESTDDDSESDDRNPNNGISVALLSSVLAAEAAADAATELDEAPAAPTPSTPATPEIRLDLVTTFRDVALRIINGARPLGEGFATGLVVALEEQKRRKEAPAFTGGDNPGQTGTESVANGIDDGMAGKSSVDGGRASAPESKRGVDSSADVGVLERWKPSPIQAVAWGALLRPQPADLVAIAPTGSGKTLAFLVPTIAHLLFDRAVIAERERRAAAAAAATAAQRPDPDALRLRARDAATQVFTDLVRSGTPEAEAKAAAKQAYARVIADRDAAVTVPSPAPQHAEPAQAIASPALLVLSPTRELCRQIGQVLDGLVRHVAPELRTMTVIGGEGFAHQCDELLRIAPHCIAATPGRLLNLCGRASKASRTAGEEDAPPRVVCSLAAIRALVMDEADVLLDLGFEDDVLEIRTMAPPVHWAMLFSATFPPAVRRLAARVVSPSALHVSVGHAELAAVATVTQRVEVLRGKGAPRFRRLCALLEEFGVSTDAETTCKAKVLVFAMYKKEARDISRALEEKGFAVAHLTGDMSQKQRDEALQRFRDGVVKVLVGTDVAARGLDVKGITHVINFSVGTSVNTYVHRVGRCGRAGEAGIAHTFVIDGDEHLLPELISVMRRTGQKVPRDVIDLAKKYRARAQRRELQQMRDPDGADEEEAREEARRANEERQRKIREVMKQRSGGGKDAKEARRRGGGKKKK